MEFNTSIFNEIKQQAEEELGRTLSLRETAIYALQLRKYLNTELIEQCEDIVNNPFCND